MHQDIIKTYKGDWLFYFVLFIGYILFILLSIF
jgi:hypothetical protein